MQETAATELRFPVCAFEEFLELKGSGTVPRTLRHF